MLEVDKYGDVQDLFCMMVVWGVRQAPGNIITNIL